MKRVITILLVAAALAVTGCRRYKVIPDRTLGQIFHDAMLTNAYVDNQGVSVDSLNIYEPIFARYGYTTEDVKERRLDGISKKISNYKKLAEELGVGEITLQDIVKELEKPARDPREDMPKPILRSDVLEMKDLKPGMILKGTVRNVIDFGAFVDIGVHQDGLVHISQMSDRFIKHPLEVVSVGDIVEVKVLDVDLKKQRIALTMKING